MNDDRPGGAARPRPALLWIRSHRALLLGAGLGLVSLVYYLSYFRRFRIDVDEGLLINGAMRVLSGQVPLKDFHQYMPGHYFAIAGWFLLFGKSILVERLFFVVLHTLKNILMFRLARRVMPSPYYWMPVLLLMVSPGFWVKGFINIILIVNLGFLWNYIEKTDLKRLILLGLAIGAGVYFREDMAGYSAIASGLIILVHGARRKIKFGLIFRDGLVLGGAILVALMPLFTLYISHQAVPDLIRGISETIRLGQVESIDTTLIKGGLPWPPRLAKGYLYYLTPLMLLAAAAVLVRWFRRRDRTVDLLPMKILAAMLLATFAFYHIWHWHNEFRFPQTGAILHLLWAFLFYLAVRPARGTARPGFPARMFRTGVKIAAGVLIVGVQVYFIALSLYGHPMVRYDAAAFVIGEGPHRPIARTIRSSIVPPTDQAVTLSLLLDFIGRKSGPGDRLFCFGESILYFLAERTNGTEFDNGRIPSYFPDQRIKFVEQFEKNKPKIMVLRGWEFNWWSSKMPDAFKAIMAHYLLEAEINDYYILTRVDEPQHEVLLGNSLLWQGDARGAATAYRRALASQPGSRVLFWNLDRLFFLEGLWERAAVTLDGFAVCQGSQDWEWRWGSPSAHQYSGEMIFSGRDDISRLVTVTPFSPQAQKVEWRIEGNRLIFSSPASNSCAGLDLQFAEKIEPLSIGFKLYIDGKAADTLYLNGRGWRGIPNQTP